MFKNEFQGGAYVEVFSAQGKDPTSHWKLSGSSGIKKEFDKTVKSFVYILDGAVATTKMHLPRDLRHSLALIQRYILLQIFVPKGRDFSVDIGIQDLSGSKRHLFFSTTHRETHITPLHTKVPLGLLRRDLWVNLCLDLSAMVTDTWRGQGYKSVESLCISASCRLRRIFTMKAQPPDTTNDEELYGFTGTNLTELDSIPRQCQLAPDVAQVVQVINMVKVSHFEGRVPSGDPSLAPQSSDPVDLNLSLSRKSGNLDSFHIAFGTKMAGTQRKGSGKEGLPLRWNRPNSKTRPDSGSDTSRTKSKERADSGKQELATPRERKNSDPGTLLADPELSVDKTSLKTSHTWTDGADGKEEIPFVKPYPPREPSSDRARRKPRVKSAGKERTPHVLSNIEDGKYYSQSTSGTPLSGQSSRASSGNVDRTPHSSRASSGNAERTPHAYYDSSSRTSSGAMDRTPHVPQVVANDNEMEHIMKQMLDSVRRDSKMSESGSESSSHKNSAISDDSISEVIGILKDGMQPPYRPGEYEESDGDEEEDIVYTFRSPPKSAPRLMAHPEGAKAKKNLYKTQKHRARRRLSSEARDQPQSNGGVLQLPEPSRPQRKTSIETMNYSSDEEEEITPRNKSHSPRAAPKDKLKSKAKVNGLMKVPSPVTASPGGSQPRMCISRKSLREIPQDDVRLSQTAKPYDVHKYQMEDFSESFERQMLLSFKRQTMEDGIEDEDGGKPQDMQGLHYGADSLSDSSEDTTSMGTLRGQAKLKSHNYQDEMKMASARLNNEFLSQSNPRDWGKVFSPPIILPSRLQTFRPPGDTLPSSTLGLVPATKTDSRLGPGLGDSDEEEVLDLLYDPELNCYFDPKSCKYYELT